MSQFIYLLNAMENAAASDNPADHDYKGKRDAVLEYVRDLEAKAHDAERVEETAARELLFWWADQLANADQVDLREVVRTGYRRIVNLANVLRSDAAQAKQEALS